MSTELSPVCHALAALRAGLDELSAVGPWQLSEAELAEVVVQTETFGRRLAGAALAAVAEGIERGLPASKGAGTGFSAPSRWLRSLVTITPGDAARRVALAQTLFTGPLRDELAPTASAVLDGSISPTHAGHIAAAIADLQPPSTPEGMIDEGTREQAQALLLTAARGDATHAGLDPTQVAKAALRLTATLDPGAGERLARDEDRRHELRSFSMVKEATGMWWAQGHLTGEAGQRVFDVVQAFAAPRPAADGTPDPRTPTMRMHDGLEQAMVLLQSGEGLVPGSHGSPNRLVISVPAQTLAAHLREQPEGCLAELPGRWPLSALSAQVMACDADLVAILAGPDGSPLDVGDTIYQFPVRQRTAIIARDGHCTFGTCTAPPPWCHVHHLDAHSHGGPTSVDNGALLCGLHHRFVHANGLIGRLVDGRVSWQAPGEVSNPHLAPVAVERAIATLARRWRRRQLARPKGAPQRGDPQRGDPQRAGTQQGDPQQGDPRPCELEDSG